MKFSLNLLDKAIDRYLTKLYNKSPNVKYHIDYYNNLYNNEDSEIFEEYVFQGVKQILNKVYHFYSLGEYTKAESIFLNDITMYNFFSEEEQYKLKNENVIIDKNEMKVSLSKHFNLPSKYEITDNSFKKQIFKFCRNTIVSREIKRKILINPNYKNSLELNNSIHPKNKLETTISIPKINIFCKGMPIDIPRKHFSVFVTNMSNLNNEPFLSQSQLDLFIDRAFLGVEKTSKIKFNQSPQGEKLLIQSVFYEFYNTISCEYFNTSKNQDIFIRLLTDNFFGWDFIKLRRNFKPKTRKRLK